MSVRELYTLGTASQVPTRYRNHNAYFLRWDDEGILFDPGEGAQRQMTMAGISVSSITRICITHFHGDHCLGFPGIVQRLSLDNVAHEVSVHYPASGQEYLDRLRRASIYAGLDELRPQPITADGIICDSDELTLEARKLNHPVDCYGYRLQEKDVTRIDKTRLAEIGLSGPRVGQLLRDGTIEHDGKTIRVQDVSEVRPGQSFAFVMDTAPCEAASELARGVDVLLCESTYLHAEAEIADRAGHMTAVQAAQLAKAAGAQHLVLAHFSQRYSDTDTFLAEASQIHGHVTIAAEPMAEDAERARIQVPKKSAS